MSTALGNLLCEILMSGLEVKPFHYSDLEDNVEGDLIFPYKYIRNQASIL